MRCEFDILSKEDEPSSLSVPVHHAVALAMDEAKARPTSRSHPAVQPCIRSGDVVSCDDSAVALEKDVVLSCECATGWTSEPKSGCALDTAFMRSVSSSELQVQMDRIGAYLDAWKTQSTEAKDSTSKLKATMSQIAAEKALTAEEEEMRERKQRAERRVWQLYLILGIVVALGVVVFGYVAFAWRRGGAVVTKGGTAKATRKKGK